MQAGSLFTAVLSLTLSQATDAATIASCDATEHGWITNFTIGILDESNASYEEAWVASPGRSPTLTATANLVENALISAAEFYRDDLGLRPPPRLQCLKDNDGPSPRIAYIVDPEYDVDPQCEADPKCEEDVTLGEYYSPKRQLSFSRNFSAQVPDIRISPVVIRAYESMAISGKAESEEFVAPAHELFHAIESAYPLFIDVGQSLKLQTREWVDEGMADAFAYAWLKHYEKKNPAFRTTIKRNLPFLDHPLHLPSYDNPADARPNVDEEADDGDEAYERSYFWSFLASDTDYVYTWRDKEGAKGQLIPMSKKNRFDPRLLIRYMERDGASNNVTNTSDRFGQWELAWLDDMLKQELNKAIQATGAQVPRALNGGLFVAYPNYAAWLLGDVTTNVSATKRMHALGEMFKKGCIGKTLNAGQDAAASIRIYDLSTRCLLLTRVSSHKNDAVDVTARGSADDLARLHLLWNGGVVVPHRDDGQAKSWRVGLPQGQSASNPTGPLLVIGIANAPEDISSMVAKSESQDPDSILVKLAIRYKATGK